MSRAIHRLSAIAVAKQKGRAHTQTAAGSGYRSPSPGPRAGAFGSCSTAGRARWALARCTPWICRAQETKRASAASFVCGASIQSSIEKRNAPRTCSWRTAPRHSTNAQTSYIAAKRAGWTNPKHAEQWTNTLKAYASPVFGKLPVHAVDTELIVQALNAIWTTKTETATRVRQRIEAVLDWATVSGFRKGENPARWGGHLEHKLTNPAKIKKVENLAALPFAEIAAFLVDLRAQEGIAARAMEFMVLTAARKGRSGAPAGTRSTSKRRRGPFRQNA